MRLHLRPVGPLPPAVYWRRRAGAVALVVLLLVLLSRCGGDEPEQLAQEAPAAPAPTAAVTAVPSPTALPTTPAPVADCTDAVLRVSATPGRARYPAGTRPVLRLAVRNGGTVPCTRPLGSAAVELLVFSGRDRIWSSDDCQDGGQPGPVVLRPQELRVITLAWDARRSRPGCAGERSVIEPGTYRVLGRVGTLRTDGTGFLVG